MTVFTSTAITPTGMPPSRARPVTTVRAQPACMASTQPAQRSRCGRPAALGTLRPDCSGVVVGRQVCCCEVLEDLVYRARLLRCTRSSILLDVIQAGLGLEPLLQEGQPQAGPDVCRDAGFYSPSLRWAHGFMARHSASLGMACHAKAGRGTPASAVPVLQYNSSAVPARHPASTPPGKKKQGLGGVPAGSLPGIPPSCLGQRGRSATPRPPGCPALPGSPCPGSRPGGPASHLDKGGQQAGGQISMQVSKTTK
jgi:hypothetical protein